MFTLTEGCGKRLQGFCRRFLAPPTAASARTRAGGAAPIMAGAGSSGAATASGAAQQLRYPTVLCLITEAAWPGLFSKVRATLHRRRMSAHAGMHAPRGGGCHAPAGACMQLHGIRFTCRQRPSSSCWCSTAVLHAASRNSAASCAASHRAPARMCACMQALEALEQLLVEGGQLLDTGAPLLPAGCAAAMFLARLEAALAARPALGSVIRCALPNSSIACPDRAPAATVSSHVSFAGTCLCVLPHSGNERLLPVAARLG